MKAFIIDRYKPSEGAGSRRCKNLCRPTAAGSGRVGTFAIQLARHLGATAATTTSAANVELVEGLGADVVIDYKTQDFEVILERNASTSTTRSCSCGRTEHS